MGKIKYNGVELGPGNFVFRQYTYYGSVFDAYYQGLTPTRPNYPVTINGNKVFANPTVFTCKQGSLLKANSGSTIHLKNNSALVAESGSVMELATGATLLVDFGSTFQIDFGATLQ